MNGPKSKETSVDTSAAPDASQQPSATLMQQMKVERNSDMGSIPLAIDEGQEPPHPSVLPT